MVYFYLRLTNLWWTTGNRSRKFSFFFNKCWGIKKKETKLREENENICETVFYVTKKGLFSILMSNID